MQMLLLVPCYLYLFCVCGLPDVAVLVRCLCMLSDVSLLCMRLLFCFMLSIRQYIKSVCFFFVLVDVLCWWGLPFDLRHRDSVNYLDGVMALNTEQLATDS